MSRQPKPRPATTASEILAQLEADPDWVLKRAARQAELDRLADQRRRALEPVTVELRAAGFEVQTPTGLHRHPARHATEPVQNACERYMNRHGWAEVELLEDEVTGVALGPGGPVLGAGAGGGLEKPDGGREAPPFGLAGASVSS